VLGIDPGARNLGKANTDERIGETVDLGPLKDVPIHESVARAIRDLAPHLKDSQCVGVAMEEQLAGKFYEKSLVAAKLFAVQGAIQSACMIYGKRLFMVSPQELKRHFNWKFMGGYNANKLWCVSRCAELYPSWVSYAPEKRNIDHACDAKLLAHYVSEKYNLLFDEQASTSTEATTTTSVTTRSTSDWPSYPLRADASTGC
jgi:Holliday junction resolvasome RuvABC endonuclease subunit